RALQGAAGLGAGALAAGLAGCGGSSSGGTKTPSLVAKPVDTTKQAVRGGIMQDWMQSEGLHFDPSTGTGQVTSHTTLAYSRLVRYKVGTVFDPPDGSVEGDIAQSWEFSADGLQLTLKVRPNMKLDPRPPTNGRPINAFDVKYFWDRFSQLSPDRGNWWSAVVPDAPI